jgi:hypothetical protein
MSAKMPHTSRRGGFFASLILALIVSAPLAAGARSDTIPPSWQPQWLGKQENFAFDIRAMVQLWGLYSTRFEVYDPASKDFKRVDDRLNIYLRRARLLFSGEPYPRLRYVVNFFFDQAGRDILAAGIGASNQPSPAVGVWDAFFQWKPLENTEALYLVAGWFRPQLQRENITSGWSVASMEKSNSQIYVRQHLTGTAFGRAAGVNIGGLINGENFGLNYNVGLFNPVATGYAGNSAGKAFSPLLAGRIVWTIGDAELRQYGINYETNFHSQRRGLSLDFNFSSQGETDLFSASQAFGPGFLFNYGPWNLDGEWMVMRRRGWRAGNASGIDEIVARGGAGHLRASLNVPAGRYMLEPAAMIMCFQGEREAQKQLDAAALQSPSGQEFAYDVGINWYLDRRNLKLTLHYVARDGHPGELDKSAAVNPYYSQPGVGAVRRGNFLGLGLNAIF